MGDNGNEEPRCEPYERLPCNELRRECYRRKLKLIKSGPMMNATKAGYIQLLREYDARIATAIAPVPFPTGDSAELMTTPRREVSPPATPSQPSPIRIAHGHSGHYTPQRQTRELSPLPMTRGYMSAEHRQDSMIDSGSELPVPMKRPRLVIDQPGFDMLDSKPPCEQMSRVACQDRWHILHSRLEIVNEKLRGIRREDESWISTPLNAHDSDLQFYETMKKHLQMQLLQCVAE